MGARGGRLETVWGMGELKESTEVKGTCGGPVRRNDEADGWLTGLIDLVFLHQG